MAGTNSADELVSMMENVMTTPNSNSKGAGFFHSAGGQMTIALIARVIVVLLAWRYVF
jgi:hypothetical protein